MNHQKELARVDDTVLLEEVKNSLVALVGQTGFCTLPEGGSTDSHWLAYIFDKLADAVMMSNEDKSRGRLEGHIARLKRHAQNNLGNLGEYGNVEREFAELLEREMLNRTSSYRYRKMPVILGEEKGTVLWWTISPFIYQHMKTMVDSSGKTVFSDEQIFDCLVEWSLTGKGLSSQRIEKRLIGLPKETVGFILNPQKLITYQVADKIASVLVRGQFWRFFNWSSP